MLFCVDGELEYIAAGRNTVALDAPASEALSACVRSANTCNAATFGKCFENNQKEKNNINKHAERYKLRNIQNANKS